MEVQAMLNRAYGGWGLGTVVYSQETTNSPTHHRDDCSGYVSMVLGLDPPGLNTETLVSSGALVAISDPHVGDFLGLCGPGTLGDVGHVAFITGVGINARYEVLEQRGGTTGPTVGVYQPLPDGWSFYRAGNVNILTTEEDVMKFLVDVDGAGIYLVVVGNDKVYATHIPTPEGVAIYKDNLGVQFVPQVASLAEVGVQ